MPETKHCALIARETGSVVETRDEATRPTLTRAEAMTCELREVPADVKVGMRPGDHPALSSAELTLAAQVKPVRG